jgi:PAS domain S-box-containing protein
MKHKLLARQLKRLGLSSEELPTSLEAWNQLLERVSKAYTESDQERYLLERSLHMSSTEMQERWKTVQLLEEQWRSLGECAPDLILMVNLDGYITFANRGRGSYSNEDLIGRKLETFYLLPDNRNAMASFQYAAQGMHNGKIEIRGIGPNREELWYSQRFSPIEKEGKVAAVLVVETDVTEQVKMSKQIEAERARAHHASKFATLGEMAGGIAHEINTPLATIQLLSNMLRDVQDGETIDMETVQMVADKIETTVGRISKIIRGLRTFARQSEGDPFVDTPIGTIVEEAMELMREKLRLAAVDIRISHIPENLSVECRCTQIAQILLNLCGNSVDAMKEDNRWIEIDVRDRENFVDIIVTDSGTGIPTEVREKIMQPFFTTKELGKGTGLGLSISKGIADQHQGQLYLDESCLNTRFVLSLPKRHEALKAG